MVTLRICPLAILYNSLNFLLKSFCSDPASYILDFKLFNLLIRSESASLPKHLALIALKRFGYFDYDVYAEICAEVGLEPTDKLMHNIRRLCRKDPKCYYNITSQYKWNY